MTVKIEWGQQRIHLNVHGDIYREQAHCLSDMVLCHVRRGIKEVDIQFCTTYYVSKEGRRYLQDLQDYLGRTGVRLSVESGCIFTNGLCPCRN